MEELKSKIEQIYNEVKNFKYRFQVLEAVEKYDYLTRRLVENLYDNNGIVNFSSSQHKLFPIDGEIGAIIRHLRGYGDFHFAIGQKHYYDCGEYSYWESVVALPRELAKLFKYRFNERGDVTIENEEEVFSFLNIKREALKPQREPVVYLKNMLIALLDENRTNDIPVLGWWSTDYSGYGSLIQKPFEQTINEKFVYENMREIGYTAKDVITFEKTGNGSSLQYFYQKRLLEEVLKVTSRHIYTVGDGSYRGRSLGMKRGVENVRELNPTTIEDLTYFAGLGTFMVTSKKVSNTAE